jgi:hypothetical protein
MGEIKSTLDIIMEKTKDLKMTDEEEREFRKRDIEGKVRGALQKFLDGLMDSNRLKEELNGLGEKQHTMAKEALLRECVDRMEPGADNSPILDALENAARLDISPVKKILLEYHQDFEQQKGEQEEVLLKRLEEKSISGTAVIPNIYSDKGWIQYLSEAKRGFRAKIQDLFQ